MDLKQQNPQGRTNTSFNVKSIINDKPTFYRLLFDQRELQPGPKLLSMCL